MKHLITKIITTTQKYLLLAGQPIPLLVIILFLIIYIPYIFKGGFIIDDWGVVYNTEKSVSFWENISGWYPLFSPRPLAPFVIVSISELFGENTIGYILTNTLLWTGSLLITALVLQKYTSKAFSVLFIVLGLVPIFSTTVIFSTVMQLTATISFFFWSLSLLFLNYFLLKKNKWFFLLLSILFLLASFSIYEVIAPLILLNFFLPIIIKITAEEKINLRTILINSLAIFLIPTISLIYQVVIVPRFSEPFSRFNTALTFGQAITVLGEWRDTILLDLPTLALSSINYNNYEILKRIDFWGIVLAVITLFVVLKRGETVLVNDIKKGRNLVLLLFTMIFLASSSLYIFTGLYPNVGSYENRGLSSAWFTLSLLLAFLGHKYFKSKIFYIFVPIIILCFGSFLISRDNYIYSYQTQNKIASDVQKLVKLNKEIRKGESISIIANVPHYTMPNYNNIEVFSNPWDIGLMLRLKTKDIIKNTNTLTADRISAQQVSISEDDITISGWKEKTANLWYYEYDQKDGISSLSKVKDKKHLEEIVKRVNYTELDTCPPNHFRKTQEYLFKQL